MRLRLELRGSDGNTAGFVIPDEVVEELGGGRRPKVVVTIGPHTWRSSIANMGGQFMLGVSMANREAAGVAAGPDPGRRRRARHRASAPSTSPTTWPPSSPAMPRPATTWATWSFTRQKEAARLLTEAKKPETRDPPAGRRCWPSCATERVRAPTILA